MILLLACQTVSPSALTTLDALLAPIARELKVPVTAKGRLGRRLVYCRMAPQPATARLRGLAKALDMDIELPDDGPGYRLVPHPSKRETTKDRLARGWNEFVQLLGKDADGSPKEVRQRRLALSRLVAEDMEQGLKDTPAGRQRSQRMGALMRIEDPKRLFLYRRLKSMGAGAVAAPYATPPSTSQWSDATKDAVAFGLDADPSVGAFLKNPNTLLMLQPSSTRRGISWMLVVLMPESSVPVEFFEVAPAAPAGGGLPHDLPADLEPLQMELRLDRPRDNFLTLGSVAAALGAKGRSFAAWCPSEYLSFRPNVATLRQLEDDTRDSTQVRFRDYGEGWVGVRAASTFPVVDVGVDWAKTLPTLDAWDQGRLDLPELRRYVGSLSRAQLTALGNARFENRNLGYGYDTLMEGANLFRAALAMPGSLEGESPRQIQEVRSLPAPVRDDLFAYLKSSRFVEDFPPLFHPRTALDLGRFQIERKVERPDGRLALTATLWAVSPHQRRSVASYSVSLSAP